MLCELSLLFNKKEGMEEQFPEVTENSLYEKLWNHLDKRELRHFGSTNRNTRYHTSAYWRIANKAGGGSIRPNPEGQINKNRKAENKKPDGRTERPNLTVRPKIQLVWFLLNISMV